MRCPIRNCAKMLEMGRTPGVGWVFLCPGCQSWIVRPGEDKETGRWYKLRQGRKTGGDRWVRCKIRKHVREAREKRK